MDIRRGNSIPATKFQNRNSYLQTRCLFNCYRQRRVVIFSARAFETKLKRLLHIGILFKRQLFNKRSITTCL